MHQFLVIAYDGTDPEAKARRLAARPAHLEGVRPLLESRQMLVGGAILDEAGEMTGSATIVEFPSRAELDAWLAADPYVTGDVWRRIEVRPFRVAVPEGLRPRA
jgi:uncharacterized protein YciI